MPDDPLAALRAEVRKLLGASPTPTRRRLVALDLHGLAEEQENIAEADERSGVRMRAMLEREQHNARSRGGRPKGSGGRFVRVERPAARSVVVHIAPALYQELGEPRHVDIARDTRGVFIVPLAGGGSSVSIPPGKRGGMPRFSVGRDRADDLGLVAGKRVARIDGGAIVVGGPLD